MSEFKSNQKLDGPCLTLQFFGTIDEDVIFPSVDIAGIKQIVIDLQAVKTINSVGIREWLNWITPLASSVEMTLMNCPKALVFQFNMVEGFLPANAKVTSFYVPYYCESCDQEDNVLFQVGQDISLQNGTVQINKKSIKLNSCKEGSCQAEMDVTEAKYFQFLKR